jgi:hypothetical protein
MGIAVDAHACFGTSLRICDNVWEELEYVSRRFEVDWKVVVFAEAGGEL